MKIVKSFFILMVATAVAASIGMSGTGSEKEYFTIQNGQLERPAGFREWVCVGTPLTPNDMNEGQAPFPEFHNVYMDPESWQHWKKTGTFREGTMLVKELISVGDKEASSGNGYFMGEFIGLEATIKSKREFPKEPGYWAYFSFTMPDHKSLAKTAKKMPAEACNACHDASAADDFVFTQFYPVIRAAKADPKKAVGGEL